MIDDGDRSSASNAPRFLTFGIILSGLLLSLIVHLKISGSALTIPADDWRTSLDVHLHSLPFRLRPLQSYATVALQMLTGITYKSCFFLIQYAMAGLTGWLFFRYLLCLGFNRVWGNIGLALFLLSFPVLAAYFEPVHTWDDFWLYSFLLLTSMAVLRHRWPVAALSFAGACLARETAMFFFPVLLYQAWRDRKETKPTLLLVCLIAPVLAFALYRILLGDSYPPDAWQVLEYNFGAGPRAADSVVSLINAFGWLLPAAVVGFIRLNKRGRTEVEQFLFWGLVLYWPLNTVASSALALVRETRLLFPPFISVIPLALYAVDEFWRTRLKGSGRGRGIVVVLLTLALGAMGVWLGTVLWPQFAYGSSIVLRRNWAGAQLGLSVAFLVLWCFRSRLPQKHE